MASPAEASATALAAHDAVVRRLGETARAVLPFRFGQRVADPAALDAALAPRAAALHAALLRVAGCVQMTLRIFGDLGVDCGGEEDPAAGGAAREGGGPSGAGGPGRRYLEARRRLDRAPLALPGIGELRRALRPWVRAERLERHGPGRLLLSVHDLVPAAAAAGYRSTVETARSRLSTARSGPQVTVSGPWPPYAFGEPALPAGSGGR